ncbi:MAG: prepilin-type N-terminal cleavage/methylation domain-containing protein [Desulfobacter sp.]|nr:MAG: prepilin-type N-terminal cleavage/methylation domain-containing protein [Desulfobacter sp.]
MSKNKNSGFTLIEVIVSLILVGILASVAGMGIVNATQAFLFSREASVVGQKSAFTMARIRKSLTNMENGSYTKINSNSFSVERAGNIQETFRFDPNTGNLFLVVPNENPHLLSDQVTSFTPAEDADSLKNFSMSLQGCNVPAVTFASSVFPRNNAKGQGVDIGELKNKIPQNAPANLCFIESVFTGREHSNTVRLFRELRDRYLIKHSWTRPLVDFYYGAGPKISNQLDRSPILSGLVKILLMPVVTLVFLFLYFPEGLVIIPFLFWLLAKLGGQLKFAGKYRILKTARGSVLIGLVITILIMGILGAGMVSLFSTNTTNSAFAGLTSRAYYLAEAGIHYALGQYLSRGSDRDFFDRLKLNNNNTLSLPGGGGQFSFQIETYWWDISSAGSTIQVTIPGGTGTGASMPDAIANGDTLSLMMMDHQSGSYEVNDYIVSGKNTETMTLTPTGTNSISSLNTDEPVLPGARTANASVTVQATELGTDSSTTMAIIGNTAGLPPRNGVITFKDTSNFIRVLQYDALVGNTLSGLHYISGMEYPSGGAVIPPNTAITFVKYAVLDSTGTVDPGGLNISQTISYSQPLAEFPSRITGSAGADEVTSLLGTHSGVTIDGVDAIKVDGTEATISYNVVVGADVYQQESLAVVDWSSTGKNMPDFLEDLWERSDKKLSYDLQAKIRFTKAEDDLYSDGHSSDFYLNHPGCYMPGISLRTKGPSMNSYKDWTYYGLSIMRGIQGVSEPINAGCGTAGYRVEEDDISDTLFYNHGSNSNSAQVNTCPGSGSGFNDWNDEPPLDGIPYLILWQKNHSDSIGCDSLASLYVWEWLSYVPLLDYKEVEVKHYYKLDPGKYYYKEGSDIKELTISANDIETHETLQEGTISGDRRNGRALAREYSGGCDPDLVDPTEYVTSYRAYKLRDKYDIFQTESHEGVTILGDYPPGYAVQTPGEPVRDPSTINAGRPKGLPVSEWTIGDNQTVPVGYIVKPYYHLDRDNNSFPKFFDDQASINNKDQYASFAARANYRIYPKEWVTVMARIYELKGNLDCDLSTGDANGLERVNSISAYLSSPDNLGTNDNKKDGIRLGQIPGTVHWPEDGDYFTSAVWGDGLSDKKDGYTSKVVDSPEHFGCDKDNMRIVEWGKDADDDPVMVYTAMFTTGDYNFDTMNIPEFGVHTLGVSSPDMSQATAPELPSGVNIENHRETAYFTDFYWSVVGELSTLFPGVQSQ